MARSAKGSGEPEPRSFTPEEADALTGRLRKRIDELRALDLTTTSWDDPLVSALESSIQDTAGEISWVRSPEGTLWRYFQFARQRVALTGGNDEEVDEDMHAQFVRNVPRVIVGLEGLVQLIAERTLPRATVGPAQRRQSSETRLVFVVHGQNEAMKSEVARTLERLGLAPVILHEQADMNRTIIEKFEAHADVGFAVVLMTADDRGGPIQARPDTYRPRARQNVLLEMGFFLGRLGRGRVCVLYDPTVEMPSDYSGVLYKKLDEGGGWKFELAREIKAAGIDVDANRLL